MWPSFDVSFVQSFWCGPVARSRSSCRVTISIATEAPFYMIRAFRFHLTVRFILYISNPCYIFFLGAGVAGTCTSAPSSTFATRCSAILGCCEPHILFPLLLIFLSLLLGTKLCFMLTSVFCKRFNTPALLLTFFFLGVVDLNNLRDEVIIGKRAGESSYLRGRDIRLSVLGDSIVAREMGLEW